MFVRVCTCVDVCGTDDVVQFNICVYVYSICMYAGMYMYVCMCVYIYTCITQVSGCFLV